MRKEKRERERPLDSFVIRMNETKNSYFFYTYIYVRMFLFWQVCLLQVVKKNEEEREEEEKENADQW